MPKEEDTLAGLIEFFSTRQELVPVIIAEPSHVEIWEEIFFFFFKDTPLDNPEKDVPSYWRPGSTDPRWDILLFKEQMGAMRASRRLLDGWKDGTIALPHKEAA